MLSRRIGLAVPVTWKNQQSVRVNSRAELTRRGEAMIRWGIAGPGSIATGFADSMSMVDGGTIAAVASRSMERAEAFGDKWGIPTRHGDYADLASDPDVDIVYVATPQSRHEADVLAVPRRRQACALREAVRIECHTSDQNG